MTSAAKIALGSMERFDSDFDTPSILMSGGAVHAG